LNEAVDFRCWPIVLQKSPTSCRLANNGQDLNPKERILESIFRIGARSRKNILRSTAQNRFATQSAHLCRADRLRSCPLLGV
jgi:hypothetical protein